MPPGVEVGGKKTQFYCHKLEFIDIRLACPDESIEFFCFIMRIYISDARICFFLLIRLNYYSVYLLNYLSGTYTALCANGTLAISTFMPIIRFLYTIDATL